MIRLKQYIVGTSTYMSGYIGRFHDLLIFLKLANVLNHQKARLQFVFVFALVHRNFFGLAAVCIAFPSLILALVFIFALVLLSVTLRASILIYKSSPCNTFNTAAARLGCISLNRLEKVSILFFFPDR